jgi:hypothetical protein
MCEWGTSVPVYVRQDARINHDGVTTWKTVEVDRCIAEIVAALQVRGVYTLGSCCGHGKEDGSILLADGRELIVKKAKETP